MSKPKTLVTEVHLMYLDDLRESGVVNMWGAAPYLEKAFSELHTNQSRDILLYWMETFSKRQEKINA